MKHMFILAIGILMASSFTLCASDNSSISNEAAAADATIQSVTHAFLRAMGPNKTDIQANAEALAREFEKNLAEVKPSIAPRSAKSSSDDLEKLSKNLVGIKEMFERAQTAWKEQHYRDAAMLFKSVSLATVPGSENYVSEARDRLHELEPLAKKRLQIAGDEDIRQEYINEAKDLSLIISEFPDTAACPDALRQLTVLRSRPDVAAMLDLEHAKEMEASGKNAEALTQYSAIASNPRYQNTVASLEANHRAIQLNQDRNKSIAISTEQTAKAERDAHALLAASKNLLLNKMNDAAGKKLKEILDTYPETSSAKEAKKLLEDIK